MQSCDELIVSKSQCFKVSRAVDSLQQVRVLRLENIDLKVQEKTRNNTMRRSLTTDVLQTLSAML